MSSSWDISKTNNNQFRHMAEALAAALREKQRRQARSSLIEFTLATCPFYRAGWFHRRLASELDSFLYAVRAKQRPRLIICAPPQHGKSELVSRRFPAYALGTDPDLGIIATSHTAALAHRFSTEVQRVIVSDAYRLLFPNTRIADRRMIFGPAMRQLGFWDIGGHRGFYRACGVGGGVTGIRSDIAIIDDPVKDAEQASSQTVREKIWNWFTGPIYSRVSEGGGIIVIMTRWHESDLAGLLLSGQSGDKWRSLCFPAVAEVDEPERRAGEPLSVERYSLQALHNIQQAIGSRNWSALYQQNPLPPTGNIIQREWIRYYRALPGHLDELIQSWDLSFKNSPGSDYVAGHVWAREGAAFYLLDRVHGRMDFPATVAAIRSLSAKWPQAETKLVEQTANGPAVVQMLADTLPGLIGVDPQGSKQSRMSAVSALFEAGNVYVPCPSLASWTHDVVSEWVDFPHAAHDDHCDAMTQALLRLQLHPNYGPPPFLFGSGPSIRPTVGVRTETLAQPGDKACDEDQLDRERELEMLSKLNLG